MIEYLIATALIVGLAYISGLNNYLIVLLVVLYWCYIVCIVNLLKDSK